MLLLPEPTYIPQRYMFCITDTHGDYLLIRHGDNVSFPHGDSLNALITHLSKHQIQVDMLPTMQFVNDCTVLRGHCYGRGVCEQTPYLWLTLRRLWGIGYGLDKGPYPYRIELETKQVISVMTRSLI